MFRKSMLLCGVAMTLVSQSVRAGSCMYIDDNFNVVEYDCDKPMDTTPDDDSGFKFNFVIGVGVGLSPTQTVSVYDISAHAYPHAVLSRQEFDTDTPLEFSLGLRLSTNSGWFHQLDAGYIQLYNLKSKYIHLADTAIVGADVMMLSYSLGYNVLNNFAVYGRAGIGYASYFSENFEFTICDENSYCEYYFAFAEDESATMVRFGVGAEFGLTDWLRLYGEYNYIMDLGNSQDFWIMGDINVQTFFVGAKLMF